MSFQHHEGRGEEHRVSAEDAFGSGVKQRDCQNQSKEMVTTASTLIANLQKNLVVSSMKVLNGVRTVKRYHQ